MANRIAVTRVWGMYFSPTGTTRKIVTAVGEEAAASLAATGGKEVPFGTYDFTLPDRRIPAGGGGQAGPGADVAQPAGMVMPGDLVILGVPVYAGRVPNLLLPFLRSIKGHGARGVPVVLFGNRNFDDALAELGDILKQGGFIPVAAAAFAGEHSFSSRIAPGRPDERDLAAARQFAGEIVHKLERTAAAPLAGSVPDLHLPGAPEAERIYYQPRDAEGNKIDIRKVKPLTRHTCQACGICAAVCPMGAIEARAPEQVNGICIKCCACVRQCPVQAKYFDDPGYLYHVRDLEAKLSGRKEPVFFV